MTERSGSDGAGSVGESLGGGASRGGGGCGTSSGGERCDSGGASRGWGWWIFLMFKPEIKKHINFYLSL